MSERSLRQRTDVPLAPFCTLGVGGRARVFVRAESIEDVQTAVGWCREEGRPLFVLGGGSNLVMADAGFDGMVLQIALRGVQRVQSGDDVLVHAAAGEPWDALVAAAVGEGLAGLECLSGIPGTAGGTPIQNVGAYGQEVASSISDVTLVEQESGKVVSVPGAQCGFAYRMSRFKSDDAGRFVVCGVTFRLRSGAPTVTYPDVVAYLERSGAAAPTLAEVRDAVLAIRRGKGMVIELADPDTRSVGSFFTNPIVPSTVHARLDGGSDVRVPAFTAAGGAVKVPAAWLIERAGFARGYSAGPVGLSSKHPLAIVNRGGAAAQDVVAFAARIKRAVVDRFGIWLRPEPVFAGFDADNEDVRFLMEVQEA